MKAADNPLKASPKQIVVKTPSSTVPGIPNIREGPVKM